MTKFIERILPGRDELGAVVGDLQSQIDTLKRDQQQIVLGNVDLPDVDPSFSPLYDRTDKRGVYVTLAFFIPGSTWELHIVLIERALATTEDNFAQKRLKVDLANAIEDAARAAQRVVDRIDKRLKYGTVYDVIKLVAEDEEGNRAANPQNTSFAGYPGNVLYSFTTPERFNTPSAPDASLILYNKLDETTPDIYDAVVGLLQFAPLTDAGAAQSYGDAGVDWAESVLTRAITDQPDQVLNFRKFLTTSELTQIADGASGRPLSTPANRGFVIVPCGDLRPGGTYTWTENVIHTMDGKKQTTGSVAFVAAGLGTNLALLTNAALTVTAPDSSVTDGKNVQYNLELTQTEPPTALKNLTLKHKKTADTIYKNLEDRWNQVQSDAYHQLDYNPGTISGTTASLTVTGVGTSFLKLQAGWKIKVGLQTLTIADTPASDTSLTVTTLPSSNFTAQAYTVVIVIPIALAKVKPSTGYSPGGVCILRARGNGSPLVLTVNFTTDADGNVAMDTARPATPSAPICQAFIDGNVKVEAEIPTDQIHTISKYRFHMSTSNTAPDRDSPSEGVDGVVKLKKGHLFVMFQRPLTDISAITYYFGVQAKNDIGWSEWSSRTSVLGTEIGRPLTDVIGSGVPSLPIALERSNTGGTSGNSTTTYVLDAGASAVDDSYNGMHLHIPSLAAANRIRKITDYVASTKTLTVDVAWSVTPGNSLAFEIHKGLEVGEKSGTASGITTTVVLGSAASGVDDFYTGMMIYLPASAAADQIRKITDYVGATKTATLETALSVAVATNDCYAISKGSLGYAAINPLSGIITGVPFRVWFDSDTTEDVIEVIMPTGENAFSVQAIQVLGYKKSNGVQRQSFKGNVNATPTYRFPAPSGYTPIFRLRVQNLFREGGSDGWSDYTYYVEGYSSAATTNYDPAAFPPIEIDFQDIDSYPSSHYPSY
jgi:hypothetical protein